MNLLDLVVKISCDDQATSGIEGVKSALSGIGRVGAVAAAGVAAVTGAVAAVGAASLNAYASYEQLVGGVDKLFGDASGKLQQYADDAYRTAGMSANQYMQQATMFSASLVNSLAGDTQQAADLADLAIRSMSDNVNVFGSDMQSVQDAFQGFAKQNFEMLDNLRLGYGGTQAEMQRLIKDASRLTDVQDKLGVTVDANSMSFDNIVKAIAVVEENMGILGTTTNEAASTIEGSLRMAQSAWDNLLVGFADPDADLGQLTTNLLDAIGNVASNVAPHVAQIGQGIIEAFPAALSGLGDVLGPVLATALSTAWNLASQALSEAGINLPGIDPEQVLTGIQSLIDGFTQLATTVGPIVVPVIQGIIDGMSWLVSNLPTLAPVIAGVATAFLAFQAIQGVVAIITGLAAAFTFLASPIGIAVAAIGIIVAAIVALATNAGGCRDTVVAAFQGAANFIGQLPGMIGGYLSNIISALAAWAGDMLNQALNAASNFLSGIQTGFGNVISFVGSIPGKIVSALGDVGSMLFSAGSSIINGLLNGLKSAFGTVTSWVGSIAGTIQSLKGPLPYDRKLLIPNGMAIMESLGAGLDKGWGDIERQLGGMTAEIGGFSVGSIRTRAASGGTTNIYYIGDTQVTTMDDQRFAESFIRLMTDSGRLART